MIAIKLNDTANSIVNLSQFQFIEYGDKRDDNNLFCLTIKFEDKDRYAPYQYFNYHILDKLLIDYNRIWDILKLK